MAEVTVHLRLCPLCRGTGQITKFNHDKANIAWIPGSSFPTWELECDCVNSPPSQFEYYVINEVRIRMSRKVF